MKKTKITALMLSLVMLYSAAVPGTWANGADEDSVVTDIGVDGIVEEIVIEEETETEDVVVEDTTEPDTNAPKDDVPEMDAPETDEEEVPVEGMEPETNANSLQEQQTSYQGETVGTTINPEDLLILEKNVTQEPDENGIYTLTLEAYTEMEVSGKITDLVLVLDQSGSMFHAADVGNTPLTFTSQGSGNTLKTYTTYINNSMTFDEMEEAAAREVASGNNGPAMTGYYMARVGNQLYALRRGEKDGSVYWYRTDDYDYSKKDGKWVEGETKGYPGTSDVETGKVKRYSEYANHTWGTSGHEQAQCYKSIYGVTYDALQAFLNEINGTPNLRVAVVGFAGDQGNDWKGTGVYLDGNWLTYGDDFKYSSIENGDYFKETWDPEEMSSLEASVNAFWPRYSATATKAGFNIASELYEKDGVGENEDNKNHIILLFSDGEPTGDGNPSTVVNNLKNGLYKDGSYNTGYITEIYTVGPNCKHSDIDALQAWATDNTHYFAPTIENMNTAFKQIASSIIETTLALDNTAYLFDEIAPSFQLPAELKAAYDSAETAEEKATVLKNNIKVYTADAVFSGNAVTFPDRVLLTDAVLSLNSDKTGVSVSNFNFSKHYVTKYAYEHPVTGNTGYHGCELVVEIPITVKPDFLGGRGVSTNTTDAGIYYANGELVKPFDVPDVNVTISTIDPITQTNNIYLSQTASLPDVIRLGEYEQNDGEWKIDGINNAYVDIIYEITDPEGNTMSYEIPAGVTHNGLSNIHWSEHANTHPLLKEDTEYTVKCFVFPKDEDTNPTIGTANPVVRVFKPEITYQDSEIHMGTTPVYDSQNFVSVRWKWTGEDESIIYADELNSDNILENDMGAAPVLTYKYSPEASNTFTKDQNVTVTAVIAKGDGQKVPEDQNIINVEGVTFIRLECSYEDCEYKDGGLIHFDNDVYHFIVHINSFNLTINKIAASGTEFKEGETFLFKIEKDNELITEVMIEGEGSVTITGLSVGDYTITEMTDWSWRYTCDNPVKQVSSDDATQGVLVVDFSNAISKEHWLDGSTYARNIISYIPDEDNQSEGKNNTTADNAYELPYVKQ